MKGSDVSVKPIKWREVTFANDEAAYGSWLIKQGIRDYRSWSEWMISKYGESVREKLTEIYSEAETRAAAVGAMEQESRELLGPSVWRSLEEAPWSTNRVREDAMLPFRIAYNDLSTWHPQRLKITVETIAILTVNRIFAEIKPLPEMVRNQCRNATTTTQALQVAQEATSAALAELKLPNRAAFWHEIFRAADQMGWAAGEAGWGAIRACWALVELAGAAAKAAESASKWGANADDVLRKACQIWIEAALTWSDSSTGGQRFLQKKSVGGVYTAWLIAAVMLVLAVTGRHPYSFYMLLRWICCAVFVYSAFTARETNRVPWAWIFGVLAVLFNPVMPVHLRRDTWQTIDWTAIGVIVVAAIVFWWLPSSKSKTPPTSN